MLECMHVKCDCDANWQIALRVWQGVIPSSARGSFNCFHILTPIVLCDAHKETARPQDIFSEEGVVEIEKVLSADGICGLDFNTMKLDFVEMIDGERVEDTHEAVCSALDLDPNLN